MKAISYRHMPAHRGGFKLNCAIVCEVGETGEASSCRKYTILSAKRTFRFTTLVGTGVIQHFHCTMSRNGLPTSKNFLYLSHSKISILFFYLTSQRRIFFLHVIPLMKMALPTLGLTRAGLGLTWAWHTRAQAGWAEGVQAQAFTRPAWACPSTAWASCQCK